MGTRAQSRPRFQLCSLSCSPTTWATSSSGDSDAGVLRLHFDQPWPQLRQVYTIISAIKKIELETCSCCCGGGEGSLKRLSDIKILKIIKNLIFYFTVFSPVSTF